MQSLVLLVARLSLTILHQMVQPAKLFLVCAHWQQSSSVINPIKDRLKFHFGSWKGMITSIFISLSTEIAILAFCGCCCIPCARSLAEICIMSALQNQRALRASEIILLKGADQQDEGADEGSSYVLLYL